MYCCKQAQWLPFTHWIMQVLYCIGGMQRKNTYNELFNCVGKSWTIPEVVHHLSCPLQKRFLGLLLASLKHKCNFLNDLSFNKTNNLMYFYKRCNPQKLSLSNPKKTNTSDFLILEIRWIDKLILKIYLQFKKICLMVKFLIYWILFLMWEEVKTSFPMFHMGITECCTCIGNVIVQT